MKTAPLDRRVAVQTNAETIVQPFSKLRGNPYIVLLGEPGIGKSASLLREAEDEGGELLTCREVMNGSPLAGTNTAYLDALDEYRSGDGGKDKLLQLAGIISASGIQRWRLTCRAEDWRDAADLNAMRRAANNEPITVAHLLPLDDEEARTILVALGATSPKTFIEEARTRGAGAFLETPLSLRLLHSAVLSNGTWPTSRFELFDKAILALAHEHDPDRATDPRPGPEAIIEAGSAMCFYVLVSGAKALWRSNALPPNAVGNEYVSVVSLGLEPTIAAFALDTALFRAVGHIFEPFHKVVAEFLAARYLAKKVIGNPSRPAFPLRRAAALVTGTDRKAPSELRGLYAWFAAHLQQEGDPIGAQRLIERDAATVLAYGDAAAFDTAGRQTILYNLDQEDPYFLTSQEEATVLGGLAGDDLADDFISILDAEVRSHLQVTVLQALEDGAPVRTIQNKLHEIALDPQRPLWMRERASTVVIKASVDQIAARRELLDELHRGGSSASQVAVRARILAGIPTEEMNLQDLRQLLSDFNGIPVRSDGERLDESGSLISLSVSLQRSPREDLFDTPVIEVKSEDRRQRSAVRSFIHQALASAIDANSDIGADRLWTWIKNAREHTWDMLDNDVVEAIQRWIGPDAGRRELGLFVALFNDSPAEEGPWVVSNQYTSVARRAPSEAIIEGLIQLARATENGPKRKRLFQVASYAARSQTHWPVWREKIISVLKQERGFAGFIKSLLSDPNQQWKNKEAKRKAKDEARTEAARRENIAELTPRLDAIARGDSSQFGVLKWASGHYRNAAITKKGDLLAKVTNFTNEEITAAIAEGFIQFAIHADIKIGTTDLGKAEARNGTYAQEIVVGAGLHQALLHGRETDIAGCPLIVGIIGLRQAYLGGEDKSIAAWAVHRLARDSHRGADEVLRYWNAALDAGDDDLDAIDHLQSAGEPGLLARCLLGLLNDRPNLPERALRQSLSACATTLTSSEMIDVVTRLVKRDDLDAKQQATWNFAALSLLLPDFANGLSTEAYEAALLAPDGGLAKAFDDLCPQPDMLDRLRIAVLGRTHAAEENDWHRSSSVSGIVRGAIRRLSASKNREAGRVLKALGSEVHSSWAPAIAHAAAEHARKLRDDLFVTPPVSAIKAALVGGPPVSPSDLTAIVLEEVERYKRTLRTGSDTPWKRYWNTDSTGAATIPQIENEDRDRLLELFEIRFEKYGIAASLPEARRGEGTRADVLLLSHAGKNLPIEAKRHYNKGLWTAPLNQLAGYASNEGACNFGLYLVFWFGTEFNAPAREDGIDLPATAHELETLLVEDLPPAEKNRLAVVVLDVSRPESMITAVDARKKKGASRR